MPLTHTSVVHFSLRIRQCWNTVTGSLLNLKLLILSTASLSGFPTLNRNTHEKLTEPSINLDGKSLHHDARYPSLQYLTGNVLFHVFQCDASVDELGHLMTNGGPCLINN